MEIREPKFKRGDKVRNLEDGHVYTVESIDDYKFMQDEYWYNISDHLFLTPESALELYIDKPKTVWDLKIGGKCYFATVIGHVFPGIWNNWDVQIENRKLGNCFLTEEEAEFEVERRKVETEMLRLGGRRHLKLHKENYCFCFDSQFSSISCECFSCLGICSSIYFDSEKEALKALNTIGKDKIKKYIFGVEE